MELYIVGVGEGGKIYVGVKKRMVFNMGCWCFKNNFYGEWLIGIVFQEEVLNDVFLKYKGYVQFYIFRFGFDI